MPEPDILLNSSLSGLPPLERITLAAQLLDSAINDASIDPLFDVELLRAAEVARLDLVEVFVRGDSSA